MTVDEMRVALGKYCDRIDGDCDSCPLINIPGKGCYSHGLADDETVKRNYESLFGKEDSDSVNHPSHYQGKHECIDEMIALFGVEAVKAFCKCNVYKYRYRAAAKNGQEDLDKADWYMDKLMELEGENHEKADC